MTTTDKKKSTDRDTAVKAAIEKIVVNAGIGRASQLAGFEDKALPQIKRDIALLAGQASQIRASKKSIAGFKMREGQTVGLRITLRQKRMVDFFERLVRIVLPRVHDFRGVALQSIDAGGALSIGFREQFVFPETNPEESPATFSLGITIVPRKKDRATAVAIYRELGVPLQAEAQSEERRAKSKRKKRTKKTK